jgi:hypothetical protein
MKYLVAYCIIAENIDRSCPILLDSDQGNEDEIDDIIGLQITSKTGMEHLRRCSVGHKLTMHNNILGRLIKTDGSSGCTLTQDEGFGFDSFRDIDHSEDQWNSKFGADELEGDVLNLTSTLSFGTGN